MNRNTISIVSGILISIVLSSAVYIYYKDPGSSESPSAGSAAQLSDQDEIPAAVDLSDSNIAGASGEEVQLNTDSNGKDITAFEHSDEIGEPAGIRHAQRAFSGEASVVEAFRNAGKKEGWGYDELVKNLLFWKGLCSAPQSALDRGDWPESNGTKTVSERIKTFCADFPSDFSKELSDFASVSLQETAEGTNNWSKRLNSISDLGPESALRLAIMDLSDAIYSGNYAEIADIVWFLGTSGLLQKELNVDESISSMFSDVEVMITVNAGIYCARLGGCGGTHPVTLGLCFQFSERQCDNPGSLHHAVEQILTGRELVAFYQMQQGILSLVSQHRRGDF